MDKRLIAVYVRVSTQEQVDGHSIPEQIDRLKKYCEAMGWTIVKNYIDPGYSGANINRPALTEMINAVKSGNIDTVLVYKLDRLSRSQKDTLHLIEDIFLKNNVEFISMCENFDTASPFGRAMIGILSVFAQLEREQIKERMAMGHLGRAKEGYWRGGSGCPIGYDFVDGKLIVNEYEALQIREIFDLFIKGASIHSIRDYMKSKYTNRYSSWNNTGTVAKILKNSTYVGKLRYLGEEYEGKHDAIITEETFKKAQQRYEEVNNKKNSAQKTPYMSKHLLSGLMFCGNCGARYFTTCACRKNKGTYYYYKCYSRDGNKQMKKMDGCKNPTYRKDELDEYVINEILKLSFNKSGIEDLCKNNKTKPDGNVQIFKNRIKEINKQIDNLMDLYQIGTIPIEDIKNRLTPLQEEKKKIEAELNGLKQQTPLLSVEEAFVLVNNAKIIFSNEDAEKKRAIVNSLIERVIINEDGIDISWKFY